VLRIVYRCGYRFTTSIVQRIDTADSEMMWANLEMLRRLTAEVSRFLEKTSAAVMTMTGFHVSSEVAFIALESIDENLASASQQSGAFPVGCRVQGERQEEEDSHKSAFLVVALLPRLVETG